MLLLLMFQLLVFYLESIPPIALTYCPLSVLVMDNMIVQIVSCYYLPLF